MHNFDATQVVHSAINLSLITRKPTRIDTEDLTSPEVKAVQLAIESECGSWTGTDGDILIFTGERDGKSWTIHLD